MRYLILSFIILTSCSSSNRNVRGASFSQWSLTPTNKTSKIRVVTNYYNSYQNIHDNSIYLLTHLGFQIDNSTNPITTKPKIVFQRLVKYYIHCDSISIVINGEMVESAIGGLSNISSGDFSGKPIVKGNSRLGTAWFEKMMVVAEGVREGIIYYSND